MLRFSLLTLLGVVLVAGIGSAALANPNDTWRQVVVTGTVVALLVAILFAVSKRPMSRFALGFAVTGWLYLVLTFSGVLRVREHLLTERVSGWLCQRVHKEPGASTPQPWANPFLLYDYDGDGAVNLNTLNVTQSPQGLYVPTAPPLML